MLVTLADHLAVCLLELHLVGSVEVLVHELAIGATEAHGSMIVAIYARTSVDLQFLLLVDHLLHGLH